MDHLVSMRWLSNELLCVKILFVGNFKVLENERYHQIMILPIGLSIAGTRSFIYSMSHYSIVIHYGFYKFF